MWPSTNYNIIIVNVFIVNLNLRVGGRVAKRLLHLYDLIERKKINASVYLYFSNKRQKTTYTRRLNYNVLIYIIYTVRSGSVVPNLYFHRGTLVSSIII